MAAARALALDFGALVRARDVAACDAWLGRADQSPVRAFRDLAVGLRRERPEVEAALRLPWSNGQTEGQVTKLKLLKRTGYGRASLALLRKRLLAA